MGCGRKNDPRASARSTQVDVNLSGVVTVPGALVVDLALTGSIRSVGSGSGFPSLTVGGLSGLQLLPGLPLVVLTTADAILTPLGGLTQFLVDGVLGTVSDGVLPHVLEPLLSSLGLDLSGVDVYLRRVPVCAFPQLVE